MIKFLRRGNKKLFQKLFSSPFIIITLVIVTILILRQQIPTSSISSSSIPSSSLLIFTQSAFAHHGQEVILSLDNSTFTPLTLGGGNQLRVLASYNVQNSSIVGQTINAVMKLYTSDGILIKTSSYPSGFVVQNTDGTAELKTTVEDPTIQSAITNITLTNAAKTEVISNKISTTVNLQGTSLSSTSNIGRRNRTVFTGTRTFTTAAITTITTGRDTRRRTTTYSKSRTKVLLPF